MRHVLDDKTIQALKNIKKRGESLVRARYVKQMQAWGFTLEQSYTAYYDVRDMFQLDAQASDNA